MTASERVQRTYLVLTSLSTLATSFIWGINTIFLLDAGLTNAQAFGANAFFTVGQVLFEVPTGVIADTRGRRTSYLLGCATLLVSTLLYLWMWRIRGPFWGWALSSVLLGLGFTFFSGATEAWLVDALDATGHVGGLEPVFARGQLAGGAAMLAGAVAGGFVAQWAGLGAPYVCRAVLLGATFLAAFLYMEDLGFSPAAGESVLGELRRVGGESLRHGLDNRPVRWVMLAGAFTSGVGFYAFYALQPFLLALYGKPDAFGVAGLAAAVVAATEIAAGLLAPRLRRLFARRTHALLFSAAAGLLLLAALGRARSFGAAVGLLVLLDLCQAAARPLRQAYLNGLIPSGARATVLSFDGLVGSAGGAAIQPALGRVADARGYGVSYLAGAVIQAAALPLLLLARAERAPSDPIEHGEAHG